MKARTSRTWSGVEVHASHSNPNLMHHTAYFGVKFLEYFERLFVNIKYSLPKMDIMTIPDLDYTHAWQATENWGMMIIKENSVNFEVYGWNEEVFQNDLLLAHEMVSTVHIKGNRAKHCKNCECCPGHSLTVSH